MSRNMIGLRRGVARPSILKIQIIFGVAGGLKGPSYSPSMIL